MAGEEVGHLSTCPPVKATGLEEKGWETTEGGGRRQERGHLLLTRDAAASQAAKDSSTHFPICKHNLFPAPKGNANWTRREEGRKCRLSS